MPAFPDPPPSYLPTFPTYAPNTMPAFPDLLPLYLPTFPTYAPNFGELNADSPTRAHPKTMPPFPDSDMSKVQIPPKKTTSVNKKVALTGIRPQKKISPGPRPSSLSMRRQLRDDLGEQNVILRRVDIQTFKVGSKKVLLLSSL
jgi:hypothetical protein